MKMEIGGGGEIEDIEVNGLDNEYSLIRWLKRLWSNPFLVLIDNPPGQSDPNGIKGITFPLFLLFNSKTLQKWSLAAEIFNVIPSIVVEQKQQNFS